MTLTTEQLKNLTYSGGIVGDLARELLANREAQPVAGELGEIHVGRLPTMNQENYPGLGDWWVQLRIGVNNDEILARVYGATPDEAMARARALSAPPAPSLPPIDYKKEMIFFAGRGSSLRVGGGYYTAPPAPAVSAVPDFEAWFNSPEAGLRVVNFHIQHELQLKAWNACRAAMLAQPVSSGYKLPPHVYRELVNSLRDTAVKFSGTEQLRERLNTALSQFIEPDHAHTRTVAPEGGNDHDTRR